MQMRLPVNIPRSLQHIHVEVYVARDLLEDAEPHVVQMPRSRNTDLANEVLQEKEHSEQLFQVTRRTAAEKQPDAAPSISIVIDSLLRIREYAFNIAENALDAPTSGDVQASA